MKEIEPVDARTEFYNQFKELFEDDILPAEWDDSRKERAHELTTDSRLNTARVATIPMVCRGSQCPSHRVCPLYLEDLHPLGMACPIEVKIVAKLMLGLMEELNVDPSSIIEVGMVRDLVDQEIQQLRKQNLLAQEDVIQENVIGVSDTGEPIMKKELHLAVSWEDKIHKRKSALLKQLLATRESRVAAGAKVLDQATNMAAALTAYAESQRSKEKKMLADLGIANKDNYIEIEDEEGNGDS
jgi:hypothetical protein